MTKSLKTAFILIVFLGGFACASRIVSGNGTESVDVKLEGYVGTRGTDMLEIVVLTTDDGEIELLPGEGNEEVFIEMVSCGGEKVEVTGSLTGKGKLLNKTIIVEDFRFIDKSWIYLLGKFKGEGKLFDKFTQREYFLIQNGDTFKGLKKGEKGWIKGKRIRDNEIEVVKFSPVSAGERILKRSKT